MINIRQFLKIVQSNLLMLVTIPIVVAFVVFMLVRNQSKIYSSETIIFTGLASGSSIEEETRYNLFQINNAFDNLINIITSRESLEEVSMHLLACHLLLNEANPKYISKDNFKLFNAKVPDYIKDWVVDRAISLPDKSSSVRKTGSLTDTLFHQVAEGESIEDISSLYGISSDDFIRLNSNVSLVPGNRVIINIFISGNTNGQDDNIIILNESGKQYVNIPPAGIQKEVYALTIRNLYQYMTQNDTNYLYNLLHYKHRHYSIKALSSIKVKRISNSDLVKISYENDDPGITQYTLQVLSKVFIKNYKYLKSNQNDDVVAYFRMEVNKALDKLHQSEEALLFFNKQNNIINYNEQTKFIAKKKEDLDVSHQNARVRYASAGAALNELEIKLELRKDIQLKTSKLIELRQNLADISGQVLYYETTEQDSVSKAKIASLKNSAHDVKQTLKQHVVNLYTLTNTRDGLPLANLLNEWLDNVILFEESKAALEVLSQRKQEVMDVYKIFAPLGANLKRLEREIDVNEREYLSLLHGLNLSKLKQQNIELKAKINVVDPPFYPLTAKKSKAKLLILAGGLVGFILTLFIILMFEYFDNTIRTAERVQRFTGLHLSSLYPSENVPTSIFNLPFIHSRLIELIVQDIQNAIQKSPSSSSQAAIIPLYSTQSHEGKSFMADKLYHTLSNTGKRVLLLIPDKENSEFVPSYAKTYSLSPSFSEVDNIEDLTGSDMNYDIIFIEIPALLFYSFPYKLMQKAAYSLLICRANREWTESDHKSLEKIKKWLPQSSGVILNGTAMDQVESLLGELPRKRSRLRRILKKLVRFQIHARYKI